MNIEGALRHFQGKIKRDSLIRLTKQALKKFSNDKKIRELIYRPKGGYPPKLEARMQQDIVLNPNHP